MDKDLIDSLPEVFTFFKIIFEIICFLRKSETLWQFAQQLQGSKNAWELSSTMKNSSEFWIYNLINTCERIFAYFKNEPDFLVRADQFFGPWIQGCMMRTFSFVGYREQTYQNLFVCNWRSGFYRLLHVPLPLKIHKLGVLFLGRDPI